MQNYKNWEMTFIRLPVTLIIYVKLCDIKSHPIIGRNRGLGWEALSTSDKGWGP
jgi:hypothetical protein